MTLNYALHETLELHELSAFKTVCLTKAKMMQLLVSDPDLIALMQQEVELSTRQLTELDGLLGGAVHEGDQA
ncbi:MAG: hypothetical protein ACM3XM_08215 [Mycobacterium leprae]